MNHDNNNMAFLDDKIACYHPLNAGEDSGYVCFTFYEDGIDGENLRL